MRDGCAVTIAGRTEAKLSSGADALRADAPAGVDVRTVACDVADEAAVRAAVATAMEAVGGLHIAVLAAGTGTFGPMLTTDLSAWQATLDTNLTGTFLGIKHAGAAIAASGGGAIVAISSIAGPAHPSVHGRVLREQGRPRGAGAQRRGRARHRGACASTPCSPGSCPPTSPPRS